jgi:hypothetical protein
MYTFYRTVDGAPRLTRDMVFHCWDERTLDASIRAYLKAANETVLAWEEDTSNPGCADIAAIKGNSINLYSVEFQP